MADAPPAFLQAPFNETLTQLAAHGDPPDPRTDIDTVSLKERFPRLDAVETRDLVITTPSGSQSARLYQDSTAPTVGSALVWVHGGAFIMGTLDMPEANWVSLELAATGVPVLSVEYTKCLGQSHFEVPADDVLAAWQYAIEHAEALFGVTPDRILIGGASAGGALAGGVVVRLRDAGQSVPAGLIAVYPAMHPNGKHPDELFSGDDPFSYVPLNYAGSVAALRNPVAFPGMGSMVGFPPSIVVVCENDFLRASVERFVAQLRDAGVRAERWFEPDAAHGHLNDPSHPGAARTLAGIAEWIGAESRRTDPRSR